MLPSLFYKKKVDIKANSFAIGALGDRITAQFGLFMTFLDDGIRKEWLRRHPLSVYACIQSLKLVKPPKNTLFTPPDWVFKGINSPSFKTESLNGLICCQWDKNDEICRCPFSVYTHMQSLLVVKEKENGIWASHTHTHSLRKKGLALCSILGPGQQGWRREQCVLGVKEGARESAASTSC